MLSGGSGEKMVDSEYVFKGTTQWSEKWRWHGWRLSSGEVGNRDLWEQIVWLRGRLGTFCRCGGCLHTLESRAMRVRMAWQKGQGTPATSCHCRRDPGWRSGIGAHARSPWVRDAFGSGLCGLRDNIRTGPKVGEFATYPVPPGGANTLGRGTKSEVAHKWQVGYATHAVCWVCNA